MRDRPILLATMGPLLTAGCGSTSTVIEAGSAYPDVPTVNDAAHHCLGTTNFGASPFAFPPPAGYSPIP